MNLNGKKIFIIGSGGKLGVALHAVFGDSNVTCFLRKDLDITNGAQVNKTIVEGKPDVVINAAAFNAVDKCEEAAPLAEAIAVNSDAPGYMAEACARIGALFVHYGSDYVFDGNNPEGYDEKSPTKPVNAYGRTKLFGESAIIKSKCDYYIIRTSRLFGPPGVSEHGRMGVVEHVLALAASGKKFEVVKGEEACPTYSYDLAATTKKMIEEDRPAGVYHVVNANPCSRFDFYRIVAENLGVDAGIVPAESIPVKRLANRPLYSVLKNTKLDVLRPWEDALKEMVNGFYVKK